MNKYINKYNNKYNNKYIAFDCETTGINDNSNLLTVSFLILDENLNETDSLNLSLRHNNGYHVYPKALEINKIDIIKHHNTSLDLIDTRRKLLEFLTKNKGQFNLIPIGHNIQFDIKFIKQSGLLTEYEYSSYISYNPLDTLSVAQFLKLSGKLHEKQSLSLINLCSSCNLKLHENEYLEHSAEYDIKMTIKLLKFFKNIINDDNNFIKFDNKKRKLSSI
jgi:DNA polymerase III alpha subunit (gram-positive type)